MTYRKPHLKSLEVLEQRHEFSKQAMKDSMLRQVFDRFLADSRVDGADGIGDFMAKTHEIAKEHKSLAQRQSWSKHLQDYSESYDKTGMRALEMEADIQELRMRMLAEVALMVQEDAQFARAIMIEAVRTMADSPESQTLLAELHDLLIELRQSHDSEEYLTHDA